MARQDINIGVEGNDGTGDSIRESFRKTNENFEEIYAIFGQSGTISFSALSDTPDTLLPNTIPLVNGSGSEIQLVELASNSALDPNDGDTITFSYDVGGKLIISTGFTQLADDARAALSSPLNAAGNAIANVEITEEAVSQLNAVHGTTLGIDDLVISKGYADRRYISSGLPIRVAGEPLTLDTFKLTISRYINGNIEVTAHGYDTSINGLKFIFDSVYNDPINLSSDLAASNIEEGNTYKILALGDVAWTDIGATYGELGEVFTATNTTSGTGEVAPVYFLRYINENQLSVFITREGAALVDDTQAETQKIYVSGAIASDDTHTMVDTGVDETLEGQFLSDVAMPRKNIVRRQGDTMQGKLTLADHPGTFEGFGTPNGEDDLQAATKLYVDSSGYASTVDLFVSTDGDDRMIGVPAGKEGASLNYAYRTIGAAAKRAEEMIETAEPEPGPYMQTVTKDNGDSDAQVTTVGLVDPYGPGEQAGNLIRANRQYLIEEISGYLKYTFPDFVYNIETCERDTGLMLDAIDHDIRRGLNANFLTTRAAEKYYSNVSGRIAITQQKTETLEAIEQLKLFVNEILVNNLYNEKVIDSIDLSGSSNERARVTTTTNHGLEDGDQVVFYTTAIPALGTSNAGMVEINELTAYIKNIPQEDDTDGKVFELYTDPTLLLLWDISSFTEYTSGGKIGKVFQPRVLDNNTIKETQTFDAPNADSAVVGVITGSGGKFDLIKKIINEGLDARDDINYGTSYKLVLNNGSRTFVDQANPDNTDTLPGKIMVGQISGAKGRIVKVINNDGTEDSNDTFELIQLNGKDFIIGESVEYGNFVKQRQITIQLETGIFEEDFPIRLADNVTVRGSEFRRTIIRPKNRVSQSKWAETYFFRDREFDDITLVTSGTPFYNQSNALQGYFGRHYLTDNERPRNVDRGGQLIPAGTNVGNYSNAANIISINKKFIQDEVIYYVDNNKNQLVYDRTIYERELGYVLDAIAYDLALGSNYKTVTAGLLNLVGGFMDDSSIDKENTITALEQAKLSVAALPEISGAAEVTTNALFDEIIDIISNGAASADVLTFPAPVSLPTANADDAATRLQNNRTFIQKEIVAWIETNYQFLDYNAVKCERDVGYIVDALTYDVLYGGNSASTIAARSYFVGTRSQLGVGETNATVAAYTHMGDIVKDVVEGTAITPTTGNTESQDTSGTDATATEGNIVDGLVDIVIDVIEAGSVSALPVETEPSIAGSANQSQSTAIITNTSTIITDTTQYLDDNIIFLYDQSKSRKDIVLLLDALIKDFVRGGREFALETQGNFYTNYTQQASTSGFAARDSVAKGAIAHVKTLLSDLLAGIEPSQNSIEAPDMSGGTGESGTLGIMGQLVDLVNFAFDIDYNPPLRNDEDGVDVFLMSDASRVQDVTVQGHAGFMVVLDPSGQILTKSPYINVGSSFSKSDNVKKFRGGMYVDAFTGNIPVFVPEVINTGTYNGSGKISNFELWVQSDLGEGLFIRPPQLPCPFYVEGRRYQVNAISDYDSANGWCKIYLDVGSNPDDSGVGQGFDETQFADGEFARRLFLQTAGNRSMLGNDFTQINDLGYGLVTNNGAFSEMVSMFTYYCQVAFYAKNGSEIRSLNGSNGYGFFGLVAEGADPNEIPDEVTLKDPLVIPAKAYTSVDTPNAAEDASLFVTDMRYPPQPGSFITIDHGGATGTLDYVISTVQNMSDTDNDGTDGESVDDILLVGNTYSNRVYKLEIRADETSATNFFGQLQATVPNGALLEFRSSDTLFFQGVRSQSKLVTRPSTAVNFDESDEVTYRSLSFQTTDSFGQPLPNDEIGTTFEIGFDFIELTIDEGNISGGYGSAQGDTNVAILPITTPSDVTRITRDISGKQPGDAGYAGGMLFTWRGKTQRVIDYDNSGAFAYITIEDEGTNISSYGGTGLAQAVSEGDILVCGLDGGATSEITISISLNRATGHDFTQIGTGGFNTSNYPNVILGDPELPLADSYTDAPTATASQVWERRKGRVFWVSTDQYGFFRVGKFFSVDQGTGDLTFGGEIGISNANSLGFKRGVTINEFSADDSMSDNSGQAVPTEKSVVGYINRVLGWSIAGNSQIEAAPNGNRIGPGFLALNGQSAMEGDIDMGDNQVTNLALPGSDGTAATNKNYVDDKVNAYDQLEDMRNIEFNNVAKDDVIVATGYKRMFVLPTQNGTFEVGDTIGLQTGDTKNATIIDIQAYDDAVYGNMNIITYDPEPGSLPFVDGEVVYDKPGASKYSTSVEVEIDEIANADIDPNSDIDVIVTRDANGTEIDFQINSDTIIDDDVKSDAAIRQSKLLMQSAATFDETTGWTGSKAQSDLGLATFSDENFDASSGFIRIKSNGIVFAEMNDIDQYTLFGRQTSGTGDPEKVTYRDAIKYGFGLEDRDFENSLWASDTVTKLIFGSDITVSNGDSLSQAGSGATGVVQGDVYLGRIVYVQSVTGTFNTSGVVTNTTPDPVASLGVPATASSVTEVGEALIKLDDGAYATTTISTGTDSNSIVRRDSNGIVDAQGYRVGGYSITSLNGTTVTYKTPGGATILEAQGNTSADLQVEVPGHLVLGGITNSGANFVESAAKTGSSYNVGSYTAASWMYTNFIEAASESGAAANLTTGIGLGAGNGFTDAAADTVVVVAAGNPRLTVSDTAIKMTENVEIDSAQLTVEGNLLINRSNSVFRIRNGSDTTNRFLVDTDNGNTTINGTLTVNGNVTLGNAASDTVNVAADIASNLIPNDNSVWSLGQSGSRWDVVYANILDGIASSARYADLAEKYVGDAAYEPGTVMVFGGDAEVTVTDKKGDHRVAGVISTNPAYLMNSGLDAVNTVEVALAGRVPCKVIGTVQKGDMLVSSAVPGYAMVDNNPGVGRVIGKALESKDTDDKGVIEVVVGKA